MFDRDPRRKARKAHSISPKESMKAKKSRVTFEDVERIISDKIDHRMESLDAQVKTIIGLLERRGRSPVSSSCTSSAATCGDNSITSIKLSEKLVRYVLICC